MCSSPRYRIQVVVLQHAYAFVRESAVVGDLRHDCFFSSAMGAAAEAARHVRVDPIHRFEVARSQRRGVRSLWNPHAATVWLQILWMPVPSRCDGHHKMVGCAPVGRIMSAPATFGLMHCSE
jgi:hypothetical protein